MITGITYFYYKFFKARLAWTRGQFEVAEVLFKQAMKYSLGVKMLYEFIPMQLISGHEFTKTLTV